MIKEALQYLDVTFSKAGAVQTHEHEGMTYADRLLHRLPDEVPIASVPALEVSTLKALVYYVTADLDDKNKNVGLFVHVVSPTRVDVLTPIQGEEEVRQRLLVACARVPRLALSDLGSPHWLEVGDMGVHLRTCFIESVARDNVVKFLGQWTEQDKLEVSDDGFGQTVVIRSGMGMVEAGGAPTDMGLEPIRTFHEVSQPRSQFVLRLRKGGHAALFSADGGAWENDAVQRIEYYLRAALPEGTRILS